MVGGVREGMDGGKTDKEKRDSYRQERQRGEQTDGKDERQKRHDVDEWIGGQMDG